MATIADVKRVQLGGSRLYFDAASTYFDTPVAALNVGCEHVVSLGDAHQPRVGSEK